MGNLAVYQHNTQTLIGQNRRTLVDKATGEEMVVDQITKRVYGSKQFWKVYLMDFLTVLGIIDSKQLDVFIYIAQNTDPSKNIFIGTYDDIARDVGVSRPTISKIMKRLQEHKFIKKHHSGVWYVNPNILMKGDDHKRQILLSYYENESPENSIEFKRSVRQPLDDLDDIDSVEFLTP